MTGNTMSEALSLLCDLVAIPSVNPEGDPSKTGAIYGEARVAEFVERFFAGLDVEVSRQQVLPGRENVIVLAPGVEADAYPICFEAHMDTVDVDSEEELFSPRVAEGRVYGRGACDTKSSLAAMMLAIRRVVKMHKVPPGGVCLVAAVDEERGHSGVKRFIEAKLPCQAAIVGEPTALEVIPAHKGQSYFEIRTKGQAAHTSTPHFGSNAIYTMAEVIQCLRARSAQAFAAITHPLCGHSALTVSIIEGGISEHIVPEGCRIRLDLRPIPGVELVDVIAQIRSWISLDLGAEASKVEVIEPYKMSPSLDTSPDHHLVQNLAMATESVLGSAKITGVPYNTDGGYLSQAGYPTVVFGPGHIAQAHTMTEYVEIDQLESAVEILTRFLAS